MNHLLKQLFLLAFILVLAGCSKQPVTTASDNDNFEVASVATVNITSGENQTALADKYGAKVISFHPEAGFAVLGFPAGQLSTLTTTTNTDFFASPEVQAAGNKAWGSGKGAWGGGMKAWGSGKGAWGSGTTSPTLPSENSAVWSQINLYEATLAAKNFGAGIKVAVIDTGLDTTHPIFTGSLAPSSEWKDFVDNDTNPQEAGSSVDAGYGHGTAVAGIILQIAPKSIILPIRVLDKDGKGDLDDVIAAIDWAVQKGAKVINLSLGTDIYSSSLQTMLAYAASKKVLMTSSSGNEGILDKGIFPAAHMWTQGSSPIFPYLYGVGSVTSGDIISSFSNYGVSSTGFAPGEAILTAYPSGQMIQATGTSFASPMMAGALALALSDYPYASEVKNFHIFTRNTSADRSSARDMWNKNYTARGTWNIGFGLLDVAGLVKNANGQGNMLGSVQMQDFDFWTWTSNATLVNGVGYGGSTGLQINGVGGIGQVVTGLRPNTNYRFSVFTRVANASQNARIGVRNFGGTEKMQFFTNTTGNWTSITFTTGAGSTSAEVYIWKDAGTAAAFGDWFILERY
jgi:thermitase